MKRFSSMTTTQIARICGVSQGTVDRALHNRPGISPATRDRILSVAREYAYVPSVKGRQQGGRSMLIGVVIYDLYNEFFSKLAMSLVNCFQTVGYSVVFLFSDKKIEEERAAIDYFNFIGVDGIVLFSVGSDDETYLSYLSAINRPIVTVGNRIKGVAHVGVDDELAMYDLTRRMLELTGEGRVQYFAPVLRRSLHSQNAQLLRAEGFRRAITETGRCGEIVMEEDALDKDAAGIICSTDHYALRVWKHFGGTWERPLAGFDQISLISYLDGVFLTLAYSTDEIAEECKNYFLKRSFSSCIGHRVVLSGEKER